MNKSRYEEVVDDDDEASEENTQELTFRIGSKIGLMQPFTSKHNKKLMLRNQARRNTKKYCSYSK